MNSMQAFYEKLRLAEQERNPYLQALTLITLLSLAQIMEISSKSFWDVWGTPPT